MKTVDIPIFGQTYTTGFRRAAYGNKVLAIEAIIMGGEDSGAPLGMLSVNLPHDKPSDGCIWLKDWSEGTAMANFMEKNGYVEPTGRTKPSGHVQVREVKLTDKFIDLMDGPEQTGPDLG